MNKGNRKANQAIDRVKRLITADPAYMMFQEKQTQSVIRDFISKKDCSDEDLHLTGRALHLQSIRVWLSSRLFKLRANGELYLPDTDDDKVFWEIFEDLQKNPPVPKADTSTPDEAGADEEPKEDFDIAFSQDERLYETIIGLFDGPIEPGVQIADYYGSIEYEQPIDTTAVESSILHASTKGTTVKALAGALEFHEDSRIRIAATYQAALQLENAGKVRLDQGEGDVILSGTLKDRVKME